MKIGNVELQPGDHWITTYECIAGYKAIEYWINPDMGGFVEPWQTAAFAHNFREQAIKDAKVWAECEGLPYIPD